ncbi:MAG: hypothetical protein K2Y37_14695 [Pirellulales bacterium]|nr:hypothetical protein [Pirellulales bacterium]
MRAAITRYPGQGIAIDHPAGPVTVYLVRRRGGKTGFVLLVDGPTAGIHRLPQRIDELPAPCCAALAHSDGQQPAEAP